MLNEGKMTPGMLNCVQTPASIPLIIIISIFDIIISVIISISNFDIIVIIIIFLHHAASKVIVVCDIT